MKYLLTSLLLLCMAPQAFALVSDQSRFDESDLRLPGADLQLDIEEGSRPIASIYSPGLFGSDLSLQERMINLIIFALTFLGIIFIIMIIYAGFLWMTSGGSEDKISKARKIIIRSIIGVAIILLAYAITIFVINLFLDT